MCEQPQGVPSYTQPGGGAGHSHQPVSGAPASRIALASQPPLGRVTKLPDVHTSEVHALIGQTRPSTVQRSPCIAVAQGGSQGPGARSSEMQRPQ